MGKERNEYLRLQAITMLAQEMKVDLEVAEKVYNGMVKEAKEKEGEKLVG